MTMGYIVCVEASWDKRRLREEIGPRFGKKADSESVGAGRSPAEGEE